MNVIYFMRDNIVSYKQVQELNWTVESLGVQFFSLAVESCVSECKHSL